MRIVGLTVALLGVFLSFARAQTPLAESGDSLLRTVKALADSGGASDPATIAAALHFSISEIDQSVSSGTGRGCPAGGNKAQRAYDVVYNTFGHEGRPVITVTSKLGCDKVTQNETTTTTTIVGIPDGFITQSQIQAIFPSLGPGDSEVGSQKSDFAYATAGAEINFWLDEAPFMFDYEYVDIRMPGDSMEKPHLVAAHHPPVCLVAMSLSRQSQLSQVNQHNFRYVIPTYSRAGVITPIVSYQTPPPDPGMFLLRAVKAIADSGRADDPGIVANLLHTSLTPENYTNDIATSCSATPDFRNFVNIYYFMAADSWFHALPTAKRVLRGGFAIVSGSVVFTGIPFDAPRFTDNIFGNVTCTPAPTDLVGTWITFANIPPYACISQQQIKSVFPDVRPPPPGDNASESASLRYTTPISTTDGQMFVDAFVDFGMMSSGPGGLQPNQPDCLAGIDIHGLYHLGGVHKLNLGN